MSQMHVVDNFIMISHSKTDISVLSTGKMPSTTGDSHVCIKLKWLLVYVSISQRNVP
jgi:hypothetical protein